MDIHNETFNAKVIHQIVNLILEAVGEKQRGHHFPLTSTRGARLARDNVECRTHTLARNLHQAKLAQWQDIVTGTVFLHHFLHVIIQSLAMLALGHVDEVDHNNAAHVAQPELACYLVGGEQVHIQGITLLVGGLAGPVARVHVYHVQSLGAFNNYVCARTERYRLSKRRLHLTRYIKLVEYWLVVAVNADNIATVGGD